MKEIELISLDESVIKHFSNLDAEKIKKYYLKVCEEADEFSEMNIKEQGKEIIRQAWILYKSQYHSFSLSDFLKIWMNVIKITNNLINK